MQGYYFLPCIRTKEQTELHIGVWTSRYRRYLKQHHRIQYYNLLTLEKLYPYLVDIEEQAEKMFFELVKSFAEKGNVTEKLELDNTMLWVQKINNICNRAMEIVNSEVIFCMRKNFVFILAIALTLFITGCISTNNKSKIVSDNEATTPFVETAEPTNSSVNTENNSKEKSILSTELASYDTPENVDEKVSKGPVISATTAIKSESMDDINRKINLL